MIHQPKISLPTKSCSLKGCWVGMCWRMRPSASAPSFPALPDERRQEIADELRKYFAEVDANRSPASPAEADGVITEAIRSTRPSYRPHQ